MAELDLQAMLTLHVQVSVRRDELLEECRRLTEADQWAPARLRQGFLTQLERAVRMEL
jgi:hypothetical protein